MSKLAMTLLLLLGMTVFLGEAAVRPATGRDSSAAAWYAGDDDEDNTATDAESEREEAFYDRGRDALDQGDWEDALAAFSKVVKLGGRRADGALYWKAYALNKLGRRPEALSTIELLRSTHESSRWVNDAKALEVEIKQSSGKPLPPEAESNEDLKLVALNGLLNMDPEQAVPMLEKFIRSGNSRQLKEQALFVLVQTGSPDARDLVTKIAKGQSNPELQRKALEYIGLFGDEESHKLLNEIFKSSSNYEVKRAILQAYMTSSDSESLLAVAKAEKDAALRRDAIQLLGAQGEQEDLWQIFRTEVDVEIKEQILQALAVSGDADSLLEAARTEKDPRLRRAAIEALGICGNEQTGAALVGIYHNEKDRDIRRAVLDALFVQSDAKAIIDIARRETDPEMKKEAVSKLSVMGSKEATDFLLELLNK